MKLRIDGVMALACGMMLVGASTGAVMAARGFWSGLAFYFVLILIFVLGVVVGRNEEGRW